MAEKHKTPPKGKKSSKGKIALFALGGLVLVVVVYKLRSSSSSTTAPGSASGTYPVAGPPGPPGMTGSTGAAGATGATGAPGATGATGKTGTSGTTRHTQKLKFSGNLLQIANRNGIGLDQLLQLNPQLSKYKGTRHVLPAGTVVTI